MPGESHTVAEGETLISIAHARKWRSWEPIWNAPENADLRKQRDPQVLLAGDVLFIPEKEPKEYLVQTNQKHTFTVKKLMADFRVRVADDAGNPLPNKKFKLELETETLEGTTDSKAVIELGIPPDAKQGTLTVWSGENGDRELVWKLQLGALDPIDTIRGVKQRLTNLGFLCGEIDNEVTEDLTSALMQFQIVHNLETTGEADDATRAKLLDVHDHR